MSDPPASPPPLKKVGRFRNKLVSPIHFPPVKTGFDFFLSSLIESKKRTCSFLGNSICPHLTNDEQDRGVGRPEEPGVLPVDGLFWPPETLFRSRRRFQFDGVASLRRENGR